MNRLTEDDYGYALEVNDVLQDMLRRDPQPRLVVKGTPTAGRSGASRS